MKLHAATSVYLIALLLSGCGESTQSKLMAVKAAQQELALNPNNADAQAQLFRSARDLDPITQEHALNAIGQFKARPVPPIFSKAIHTGIEDSDVPVRRAAAEALISLSLDPSPILHQLRLMLKSGYDDGNADIAARAIGTGGQLSAPAVGDLIAALQMERGARGSPHRQIAAAIALGQLGRMANKALPELKHMEDDPDVVFAKVVKEAIE